MTRSEKAWAEAMCSFNTLNESLDGNLSDSQMLFSALTTQVRGIEGMEVLRDFVERVTKAVVKTSPPENRS